ncbi:MAG: hypothetical protein ABSF03_04345 [Streptosporangiaceae bacterium]
MRGRRSGTFLAALSIAAFGVTACSGARPAAASPAQPQLGIPRQPVVARTHAPSAATVVLTGSSDDQLAAGVAQQLFLSAPVAVVSADDLDAVNAAATDARRLGAPLLLTAPAPPGSAQAPAPPSAPVPAAPPGPRPSPGLPPSAKPPPALAPPGTITPALRTEITNLHPRDVLAVGLPARVLSARLPGVQRRLRARCAARDGAAAAAQPRRRPGSAGSFRGHGGHDRDRADHGGHRGARAR